MLLSYLKVTLRILLKSRAYSAINIAGLAMGLASCLLILLWTADERSYDQSHENVREIYQVSTEYDEGSYFRGTVPALGPALLEELPEVVAFSRFYAERFLVTVEETAFKEIVFMADPGFLGIFDFPLIEGDAKNALLDPNSILLTSEMATKYYGDENPIGKVLTLDREIEMKIVGVLQDIPANSTLRFDFLSPLSLATQTNDEQYLDHWWNCSFRTFVQLQEQSSYQAINTKIAGRIKQERPEAAEIPLLVPYSTLRLQGLRETDGTGRQVRLFTLIGFLILTIAAINFTNLTTARSAQRAREVGIRKVLGAERSQLLQQFFGESLLFTMVAFVLALVLVELALPGFRDLTGKSMTITNFLDLPVIIGTVVILVLTGLLSGIYPALYLSSFQPAKVLKGAGVGTSGARLRTILVVTQFTISIALTIVTAVIYSQLQFMLTKDLGFDKEQMLFIRLDGDLEGEFEALKKEILSANGVLAAAASSAIPAGMGNNTNNMDWEGRDPDFKPLVTFLTVDQDFLDTYRMKMVEGSYFSDGTESTGIIVNEAFARLLGGNSALGKNVLWGEDSYPVIGVVKDFHYQTLNRAIEPILLMTSEDPNDYYVLAMRIAPDNISSTLASIEATVNEFNPNYPFEYRFLDDRLNAMYRDQQRTGTIVAAFSVLAVAISALGLFGLAAFMAERRSKEIGVRKVLGASVAEIVAMLTKEFAKWILVANFIAWPLAFLYLRDWLQDFPYRVSINFGIFVYSGLAALLVATLAVSYQALMAARANPIDAIRWE